MLRNLLLSALFISPTVCFAEETSPGPSMPEFSALSGSITLRDGAEPVTALSITLTNPTEHPLESELQAGAHEPVAVTIEAGATSTVDLLPSVRHAGDAGKIQRAEVDLTLLYNGEPVPAVSDVSIDIEIPSAAYPLIRSEPPAMERSREADAQYEYFAPSQQLQPLKFTYNPGPVNLQVRKTVYPIPVETGPVEISIEVTNHGDETTAELTLRDTLEDADFAGKGENFTRFVGEDTTDLVWEFVIPSLEPGESRRVNYTVEARYAVGDKQLPATTIIMNDELTGLSNKVWLPKWH